MKPKFNRKSNGAFTLVEIIGVMAIIGILGAVVAPRVIDGIREGRVTQLAQNVGQWKSGADRYLQKNQKFTRDGTELGAPVTQEGGIYTDPTGQPVSAAQATLGDWLLAQGLVSAINVPFGTQENTRTATLPGAELATPTTITSLGLNGFAQIRCSQESDTAANSFTATQTRDVPHRVVYLAIPAVPLQEAAAIKSKIDGPFTAVAGGPIDDTAVLTAASDQSGSGTVAPAQVEAVNRGNCRVSTAVGGTYNLFIYITND